MTKIVPIEFKRYTIMLGDGAPIQADARMILKDEITGEASGLAWFVSYDDHNEVGTAKDMPYVVIDREYPYSLQDFLSMAIKEKPDDGIDPRDAQ
jgi:hypothetical protein